MEFDGDLWTMVRSYCNPVASNGLHGAENNFVATHSQLPFNENPFLDVKSNYGEEQHATPCKDSPLQPTDYQEILRKVPQENLKNLNLDRAKLVFHGVKRKRELLEVEILAEDLAIVDEWCWRKYGSKITKASPHPKSYYKCNNTITKCQAKKYVQRISDEGIKFIVSYVEKHNHDEPTQCDAHDSRKRCSNRMKTSSITPAPQAMETERGLIAENYEMDVVMIKQEPMEMEEIEQPPQPAYNNDMNWFLHDDDLQDDNLFAPDTSWSTIFWASALV